MARIFSGIQPSGELHIGNYLGAVKNWVHLQQVHADALFCVVDYHAITGNYDPALLRTRRWEMAKSLLAAGIDPSKASLFMQSDVPEHTELSWVFTTLVPVGDLERQIQEMATALDERRSQIRTLQQQLALRELGRKS